jgi:hypothetical protein
MNAVRGLREELGLSVAESPAVPRNFFWKNAKAVEPSPSDARVTHVHFSHPSLHPAGRLVEFCSSLYMKGRDVPPESDAFTKFVAIYK